jgi:hypothetical protein
MHVPLARPDYYGASVPPGGQQLATNLPTTRPAARRPGRPRMVPTFTRSSIGQAGAQLYPGSFATPTPQAFNVASPPSAAHGFGVDPGKQGHALHPRPLSARFEPGTRYGASTTDSLALRTLALLAGPAPSGSTSTSRHCRGCFPPSPSFPGSSCPQLQSGRCDDPTGKASHPSRHSGASWRTQRPSTATPSAASGRAGLPQITDLLQRPP